MQELDEANNALQVCVKLMKPGGKAPSTHRDLVTEALRLCQDANKALTLTDQLFDDFAPDDDGTSPQSTITSLSGETIPKNKLTLATRTEALVEAMKTLQNDSESCFEENDNLQRRVVFLLQQEERLQEEREAAVKREQFLGDIQEKLNETEEELTTRDEELKRLQEELKEATQKCEEATKASEMKDNIRNKRDSLLTETEYLQQDVEDLLMTKGAIEEVLGDILVSLESAVEDLEVQESAMLTEVQRAESVLRLSSTSAYAQEQKVLAKLLEAVEKQSN
ncbi:hypothetical protein AGDE_16875 [Angomonas deanei]|nr:hypothetical protein AGDE_16875 [Angomonas deanei]|eukprot:EPY16003.1 hypothetical protein AGDE_16875 [Angomonas deanei]